VNWGDGFNISEAIDFKMQEDEIKKEGAASDRTMLRQSFAGGNGKKWLDNAVVWIYRRHFTFQELKQMEKFYKTPAGKKLATNFPVIMLESLAAAQIIHDKLVADFRKEKSF
jgi:uncharacterized protein